MINSIANLIGSAPVDSQASKTDETDSEQIDSIGGEVAQDDSKSNGDFEKQLSLLGSSVVTLSPQAENQIKSKPEPEIQVTGEEGNGGNALDALAALKANSEEVKSGQSIRGGLAEASVKSAVAQRVPISAQTVAGLNTASAIAGQTPWSKDWVFKPGDEANSELKPLLGPRQGSKELDSIERQLPSVLENKRVLENPTYLDPSAASALNEQGELQMNTSLKATKPWGDLQNSHMRAQWDTQGSESALIQSAQPRQPIQQQLSGAEYLSALTQAQAGHRGMDEAQGSKLRGDFNSQTSTVSSPAGELQPVGPFKSSKGTVSSLDAQDQLLGRAPQVNIFNAHSTGNASSAADFIAPSVVSGHVALGSMAKERLSTDSLVGLSTEISRLRDQGGEVRMKLKPDNMGELVIQVRTQGSDVGLRIQASDERAKHILEHSMSSLKDSLASHQLNLARIDVSVNPTLTDNSAGSMYQDGGQSNFGYQSNQNRHDQPGQSYASRESSDNGRQVPLTRVPLPSRTGSVSTGTSGRLDVRV